jgi:hypothetical protein
MTDQNVNPGAGGTGVKGNVEAAKLQGSRYTATHHQAGSVDCLQPAARLRYEKWAIAKASLEALDPHDAATLCAAVLDVVNAGDPRLDPFGDIRADAAFWADCANIAELEAYFAATLKKLGNQALGKAARKRLFVAIWQSFTIADRQAFLSRVDPNGKFHREAAQ